jgi:hypothetical protein
VNLRNECIRTLQYIFGFLRVVVISMIGIFMWLFEFKEIALPVAIFLPKLLLFWFVSSFTNFPWFIALVLAAIPPKYSMLIILVGILSTFVVSATL